ncbi:hypothetical protein Aperf_G00000014224 [Anoplocephala perfoliata]
MIRTANAASAPKINDSVKQVAGDLRVGVNHLALDKERLRQEQFLQGIIDLQHRIIGNEKLQQRYGEEVEDLKNSIRQNADVLSYLKSITKLEVPLTELTNKIAQAAVEASSSKATPQTVFSNKALTENVNNCWEYIVQLSAITQAHLKDAASYQQFHHMANEVDAHIDKMLNLAEMKLLMFEPEGLVDEAVLLTQELENDHVEFVRAWEQTCQLTETARRLKPIQSRSARVVSGRTVDTPSEMAQQVVMVKALIDISGPDFAIRKGEEMILMNNENPNFWRVKTAFGEREVSSLIFTIIGPNQDEVFRANSLQRKCASDWKRVLERTKGKLVKYYTTVFERYCKNDTVYFAHEDEMNAFLDDLDTILIAPNYDNGILHNAYDNFMQTLMLLSPNRRPPRGALSLTASDIRVLHEPLRRILNQTAHADQVQARVSMSAEDVQKYLKSVEDERLHIFNEISRMEKLHQEEENQLKNLQERMNTWKTKRKAFDRAITDYTSEPVDDILKHFPTTRLSKPRISENNYRSVGDPSEADFYESSDAALSSSDYGQIAKQMVTTRTRPKANGLKFAGAASLKRSASTNDLQTQILPVTVTTGTQFDPEDDQLVFANLSESSAVEERRKILLGSSRQQNVKSTSDVQAQILRVNKNVTCQVGVRVLPKAIDLSHVGIKNLGLEVQNSKESEGLGLRVGELLYPVAVGTSVELYEGPGVQVLGVNDVDSLNLELKGATAHATTDSHRLFKVRDVQAQVITRPNSQATGSIRENLLGSKWSEGASSSEVQTLIGILNKPVGVQAVAKTEVVSIPSHRPKVRTAEGTYTAFCLLPDKEPKEITKSEPTTSDVITQISCILHSRGIHSDLESYLSEYKQRNSITETSDLCTQIQQVGANKSTGAEPAKNKLLIGEYTESKHGRPTSDTETFIGSVMRDNETQVSSKLVPTEVTISKINTKNMEISLTNLRKEISIGLPVDSLICPADMKFQTELYEGSDISIADYSGVGNLIVTHDKEVAFGSLSTDGLRLGSQTSDGRGLSTQAAVVLRIKDPHSKAKTAELAADADVVPKLTFVVSEVAGRPSHEFEVPTSDLQTQISDMMRPAGAGRQPATDYTRRKENVTGVYSTTGGQISHANVSNKTEESLRAIGEILCPKCYEKYYEIQMRFDPQTKYEKDKQDDVQTQISYVLTAGVQPTDAEREYAASEYSVHTRLNASDVVVSEVDGRPSHEFEVPTSDLQTQISDMMRPAGAGRQPATDYTRRKENVTGVYSTTGGQISHANVSNKTEESLRAIGEILCPKCYEKYYEIQMRFDPQTKYEKNKQDDVQTQISYVLTAGVQPTDAEREYAVSEYSVHTRANASDVATENTKLSVDASMQVGSQLVPLSFGISPVLLKNMEVSIPSISRGIGEQTSPASAILYPAQVELQNNLVDGQSGIQIVPLENVDIVQMKSSGSEAKVQYRSSLGSDVQTQIVTEIPVKGERSLLPASLVLETGQFDGHCRGPTIASQAVICELLNNRQTTQTISIRAKSSASEYSSERPSLHFGYVTKEAIIQTADSNAENAGEEFYHLQTVKRQTTGVQVGTKLIPQVLKLSQIPVKNLKLEDSVTSFGHRESLSLQAIRCPAEMTMKTELCDDSGIVICSLDQSGEVEIEMARYTGGSQPITRERSTRTNNKGKGWWSGIISGKTPLFENKSMENVTMKKAPASTSTHVKVESRMTLQAEAILQPETGEVFTRAHSSSSHDPNPHYKLVMVDSSDQNTPKSLGASIKGPAIPDRELSSMSAKRQNLLECGVQVGIRLIPNSIEVKPLKLENMKAVLTGKTTRVTKEVDVSAILCTSGIQYYEELSEVTGVRVVEINESGDLSLNYCGDRFTTSIASTKKGVHTIGSKDLSKQFEISSAKSKSPSINTLTYKQASSDSEAGEFDFITTLRVKDAQYSTGSKLTRGNWEDRNTSSREVSFAQNRTELENKEVQVGLNLVPKAVAVDKIGVENLDVVNEQKNEPNRIEQFSVGILQCSVPTQYDQVLTESRGVSVLPIKNAHDVELEYNGEKFYTTVDAQGLYQEGSHASTHRGLVGANFVGSRTSPPRLRVHHVEFSAEENRIGDIDNSHHEMKVHSTTQVGTVLVPTELKLQQMSLDTNRVAHSAKPVAAEMILCPTDMAAVPILSECSGVQIASVGGTSEISLKLNQGEYNAEVLRDTQSNQTRIAIKEMSITAPKTLTSGSVPLIKPSSSISSTTQQIGQSSSRTTTNSTSRSMNSKSLQVGTLLIPTAVTVEKVKVDNLEVSVPLNQARNAEVNVSAVLASSATEMTPVLTNTQGIHVLPLSRVDEVGVQVNGKSYVGAVEGSYSASTVGEYQSLSSKAMDGMSMNQQNQQKIILPFASMSAVGMTTAQANLLRQSADLSLIHEALRSGQVTPTIREVTNTSSGSFRRPGVIQMAGQTLTPKMEISSAPSLKPMKEVRDDSVQDGLRIIPQTISVQKRSSIKGESASNIQRNLKSEEVDVHNLLSSSDFQYQQVNTTPKMDKDVQVGLNLVPKAVAVDKIGVENLDVVNEQKNEPNRIEQFSVGILQCSVPTQYDQVLTESRGVSVLPIKNAHDVEVEYNGEKFYTTVDAQGLYQEGSHASTHRGLVGANFVGSRTSPPRLRVHHVEFSAEENRIGDIDNSHHEMKVHSTTQVGTVLVPTELKLQQMSLDTNRVAHSAKPVAAEMILCPTDMAAVPILSECSGVQIASVGGTSEISLKLNQGEYNAEVLRDTQSNQTRIAIKEMSITAPKTLTSGSVPLIKPSSSISSTTQQIGQSSSRTTTSSTSRSMNSKSLQVGTLLIPTAVTVEKVKVDNLEVSVPLNQARNAEVNVSAVLASSATEMTPVLTNTQGIHVLPLSRVDEVGVQVNGKSYVGAVEGSYSASTVGEYQSLSSKAMDGMSMNQQNQQKIILPFASMSAVGMTTAQANLLRQSADLSLIHEALRSGQVTPTIREVTNTSSGSFRRPGVIQMAGQTLTPKMEISSAPSLKPMKETISVQKRSSIKGESASNIQRNLKSEEVDVHNLLSSSDFQYQQVNTTPKMDKDVQVGLNLVPKAVAVDKIGVENLDVVNEQKNEPNRIEQFSVGILQCSVPTQYDQVLTESRGVSVLPIKNAHDVEVEYNGEKFYTTVDAQGLYQEGSHASTHRGLVGANFVGSRTSPPRLRVHHVEFSAEENRIGDIDNSHHEMKVHSTTQVGTVLVPTELKLQQMSLDTNRVAHSAKPVAAEMILCPTDMAAVPILSECSGVQIASVGGTSEISLKLNQGEYNAEVLRDTQSNQTRIAIKEMSITAPKTLTSGSVPLIKPSSSISSTTQQIGQSSSRTTTSSASKSMNSKSLQVGTLLIPTAVTVEKVKVDNLEVSVPLNQARNAEVNVSAVLASSATEMTPVLTNTQGIHVLPLSRVDEVGVQVNGKSYVGAVEGSYSASTVGEYQSLSSKAMDGMSMNQQNQQKIILPFASMSAVGMTTAQANLLRQSADLSLIHEALRSGQVTPTIREVTNTSSGSFRRPGVIQMAGQTLTPKMEISSAPSLKPMKEVRDDSVQDGLRIIPQTISVQKRSSIKGESASNIQRNLKSEEVDVHNLLSSSDFQYQQVNTTPKMDKDVQVGLNLVPKAVAVDKIGVENLDVVNEQKNEPNRIEQFSVGILQCSVPTQYDQVLTESRGVSVLPIKNAHDVEVEYNGEKFYTTVDAQGLYQEGSHASTHRGLVGANFVGSRTSPPRLRVHHVEFSAEENRIGDIDNSHHEMKVHSTTQVGTVLVPTELKLQQMSLDTNRVAHSAKPVAAEMILCPTDMAAVPILSECSGVQIASVGGTSEISLKLNQGEYNAEVLRDTQSNQTRIAIKEMSITAPKTLTSGSVPLIKPSSSISSTTQQIGQSSSRTTTSSTSRSMNSKSLQVGTLLIPTAVTVEKVKVDNLEVSVPLNQARNAEVNVSAVLASSATEMTPVLTNTQGIHVLPLSRVDEVGVQVNGKSYVGAVEGSYSASTVGEYQSLSSKAMDGMSMNQQNQQKIILPFASMSAVGMTTAQANLFRQSADLSLIHEALRSGQVTPTIREVTNTSSGSFRRPGVIQMAGQTLTPKMEISSAPSLKPMKEVRDDSVQDGLRIIPQTISVQKRSSIKGESASNIQRNLKSEEVDVHNLLSSSDFQYQQVNTTPKMDKDVQVGLNLVPKAVAVDKIGVENLDVVNEQKNEPNRIEQFSVGILQCSVPTQYDQVLTESRGVSVLPIKNAHDVEVEYNGEKFYTTVDAQGLYQEGSHASTHRGLVGANFVGSRTSPPRLRVHHVEFSAEENRIGDIDNRHHEMKVHSTTQVGTVLVPTELKLQQMSLDTNRVAHSAKPVAAEMILCPTDMAAVPILSECSGVQIASVGGTSEISLKLNQGEYNAEVLRDTQSNQTRIAIKEMSITAPKTLTSGSVPLIKPSSSISSTTQQIGQSSSRTTTSSTSRSMNSKSLQVGTLLIPTAVTVEKVKVDNLEVSVPLNQARNAEVNVSAVLASSATEMTPVLTNTQGIHVLPLSRVDEVGVQVNGKSYVGAVEGSYSASTVGEYQSLSSKAMDGMSMNQQNQQKIILPFASMSAVGMTTAQANLLRQSADLSLIHEALRSGQVTPTIREVTNTSSGSFRRPGVIQMAGQTLTPKMEISSAPSLKPMKEVRDDSVQDGLRIIPQTISVQKRSSIKGESASNIQRNLKSEEVDVHNLLSSSDFQYQQVNTTPKMDKDVQVGLNLVPKAVAVDKIGVENLDVVNEQKNEPNRIEQFSVGILQCSVPTQYDQVLTESRGVSVLPIKNAHDVEVEYNGEKFYTTVDAQGLYQEGSHASTHRGLVGANFVGSRTSPPRLRVHHVEFSAEENRIGDIDNSHHEMKVHSTTQVGTVLVPTELKLQQMSLDTNRVAHSAKPVAAEMILCPTDMAAVPILSECSGVQIASVGGTSEISLKLNQGEYNAEVLRDTQSNQTRIAIKEMSITAPKTLTSGSVPLIKPSSSISSTTQQIGQSSSRTTTSSTSRSMNSKSLQVGTLLIPTAVTVEKVKVDNLEVSVPLNQARNAEVNVSAVLASSATEMTPVLTNTQGIHVLPLSRVDEVGVQVNGKSYVGAVEGSYSASTVGEYQSLSSKAMDGMSMNQQNQQKIILPFASMSAVGMTTAQANLLRQSADLSLIHEALRSGQVTPTIREVTNTSSGSFRRPGVIQMAGQTLTPKMEISSAPSLKPMKEVRDDSVQDGLRIIPQTISVQKRSSIKGESASNIQRNLKSEEVDVHNLLSSSDFQYQQVNTTPKMDKDVQVGLNLVPKAVAVDKIGVENLDVVNEQKNEPNRIEQFSVGILQCSVPTQYDQVLTESRGVSVLPIKNAHDVEVEYNGEKFYTTVDAQGLYQEGSHASTHRGLVGANFVGSRTSPPRLRVHHVEFSAEENRIGDIDNSHHEMKVHSTTQVGTVLVPTELKLQQMSLDTNRVAHSAKPVAAEMILCPTDMAAVPILSECSGVQIASVGGTSEISLKLNQGEYNAEVLRDTQSNQTRIAIKEMSITAPKTLTSGSVPLIKPSSSISSTTQQIGQSSSRTTTSSTSRSMNSKSLQVGTLLIPTAVTVEKVKVDNLEVSVPLNQARNAEVNVSAVLASSATEMTPVLTNTQGIHVLPLSRVDEVGVQVNGKSYVGAVEGSYSASTVGEYQSLSSKAMDGMSMNQQNQQKIILPFASMSAVGMTTAQANLLRQSADLSLIHEALRSGQVTPTIREVTNTSSGSFRRPGVIQMAGQTLTSKMEISSAPSLKPMKEVRDDSVQDGLKIIPQTISVQKRSSIKGESASNIQRNLKSEEVDVHNLLSSSESLHDGILRESIGSGAYAAVFRGTEPLDDSMEPKEQTNLYHALRNNRIIQAVIADYERNKQSVEGRFSAEAKEISNVVAHAEKEYGNVANDRTIYSQLSHNSLVQRVVESYEAYKQSTKIDAATQTSSTPMQGQVLASGDIQEIIDVVNAFEHAEGSVEAGRTMYTELKGNPIIQRLIKEFEVDRTARASIRRPSSTPPHTEIPSTRDSKEGILSLDGQVAKMESEQFATPDIMVRGSVSIIRRQQRPHSREKLVSSSISSGSEDEDRRDWRPIQSTPSIVRFDVATSAYITPETWDKKMQFDSLDQRQ